MNSNFRKVSSLNVSGEEYRYFSLKELEKDGHNISRLPYSIRIILESLVRNLDGRTVTEQDILNLINWNPGSPADSEIPFKVSRVVMQDFTGVPAMVDLAAMRDAAFAAGKDPEVINPQVPVDLVIDHSVQVDFYGQAGVLNLNVDKEFSRNEERYRFLKWAQKAFRNTRIVPPSVGIVHQVNLEYLAQVVMTKESPDGVWAFPDTLVGTDSHTTMVDGLGVVGWGVGGIEAEAAMLDQPVTFKTPEVIGVRLRGKLAAGITATDLVLTVTELLRKNKVVDKFVEFFGDGVESLTLPDRATISNMCPEYGATVAMFPVDGQTLDYLRLTGRTDEHVELVEKYFRAQGLFGSQNSVEYTRVIDLDLGSVKPSVSGPKLPQQRVDLGRIGDSFLSFMESNGAAFSTSGKSQKQIILRSAPVNLKGKEEVLTEGDVVIAAITSCTNTSNPYVMLGAGLLARKAVEKGLRVNPKVKTSLAPGSRVVSEYLDKSGLQEYLDKLGFYLVGYGCTTCIGNSGPLDENIENAIVSNSMSTAAVLSGNRNFEARIHRNVRANYLMSPPLVVAFAIAGRVTIDLEHEPLGMGSDGRPVYLKDIWPTSDEILSATRGAISREMFVEKYRNLDSYNERWTKLDAPSGKTYAWDDRSTYIRKPPFFDGYNPKQRLQYTEFRDSRPLLVLGDSVTTDHISPAGSFSKDTPAGKYLVGLGVKPEDFNSYGSRRGNHEVMMRGTFANNRIRNLLANREGGFTIHFPDKTEGSVYDVAMRYLSDKVPEVVLAGDQYGTGSSRDWAAKGTLLLGVRTVLAAGYERIHRSNLVGMGVVPLQFNPGDTYSSLKMDFTKPVDVIFDDGIKPQGDATVRFFESGSGTQKNVKVKLRVDTPVEVEYLRSGGILQFVLGKILEEN